jgi:hypothetical protein
MRSLLLAWAAASSAVAEPSANIASTVTPERITRAQDIAASFVIQFDQRGGAGPPQSAALGAAVVQDGFPLAPPRVVGLPRVWV